MTTGTTTARDRVFISYSRKDREWVERVRLHLRPLERDLGADVWDDSEIEAGADWMEEIKVAVASARAVVLLVSAAFLASDFIESNELPPLLDAANKEGVRILPLHVKPSRFLKTEGLKHFQSVNDPARPLIGLTEAEQEEVLVKLADAVERAFTHTTTTTKAPPPQTATALNQLPRVKGALEELRQQLRDKFGDDDSLYEPAALIAESILLDGLRAVARRVHPKQFARALTPSLDAAHDHVRAATRPLEPGRLRSQVIRYAAADPDIALLVENALGDRAGVAVRIEAGRQTADEWELVKGLRFPYGFVSPDFIPAEGPREVVFEDVTIYTDADTVADEETVAPLIRKLFHVNQSGTTPRRSLLIVAGGLKGGALRAVLHEKAAGRNITAALYPGPDAYWKSLLFDLVFATLSRADKVIVNEYETYIIIDDHRSEVMANVLLAKIRGQLAGTPEAHERDELTKRLNALEGGVGIIRVGGKTEEERQQRAERARRAVRHYEAAAVSGVVAGEHLALANAAAAVCARAADEEQKQADVTLSDALEMPLRRMAEGWGREGEETLRAVRARQLQSGNGNVGYYGEDDSFVDLFEVGAVVPAEFVVLLMREAVEAAAGRIASLRFTDEVVREVAALEG